MNTVVDVNHVTKRFGSNEVLKDVSLICRPGNIYGLVGRNGSGKTVLLKSICGLVHPTSGEIRVWGQQVGKDIDFPENIGFIIESPGFPLTRNQGICNLKHLGFHPWKGRGLTRSREEYSSRWSGTPDLKLPVGKYSHGYASAAGGSPRPSWKNRIY